MQNIFSKGDILEATDRGYDAGLHYIIFYEGDRKGTISYTGFIGGVITHKVSSLNIKMTAEHFEINDENDNSFKITYDNSFLVKAKLTKPGNWGPYTKVGQLTKEGIIFFEEVISELPGENWDQYKSRTYNIE